MNTNHLEMKLLKTIERLILRLKPPPSLRVPVTILTGVMAGLMIFLFYVSNAASYLSDDPATCINCHIMQPEYASWFHSSHQRVANCNDCHVPHNNVFNKYYFKAKDGLRHATMFTLRAEPQVIKMHKPGQNVVQQNCLRCHQQMFDHNIIELKHQGFQSVTETRQCWECHRTTPHGSVKGLATVPNALVPILGPIVPDWLKIRMKESKNNE